MRAIKFRGLKKDGTGWVCGDLITGLDGLTHISPISDPKSPPVQTIEIFEVDPKTVGQYTGFKDRNGKEIYEGDIIEYLDCDSDDHLYMDTVRLDVYNQNGNFNLDPIFNRIPFKVLTIIEYQLSHEETVYLLESLINNVEEGEDGYEEDQKIYRIIDLFKIFDLYISNKYDEASELLIKYNLTEDSVINPKSELYDLLTTIVDSSIKVLGNIHEDMKKFFKTGLTHEFDENKRKENPYKNEPISLSEIKISHKQSLNEESEDYELPY